MWFLTPCAYRPTGTFYSRAEQSLEEDELCQPPRTEWQPDLSGMKSIQDCDPEDLGNDVDQYSRLLRIKHKAVSLCATCRGYLFASTDYKNIGYLQHNSVIWLGSADFEKEACTAILLMMERQYDVEERRLMNMVNPDAHLFDE